MVLCYTVPYSKESGCRKRKKKRFEGWSGNLPDLHLVKSDEEDMVVKICIFDDGTKKLLAKYEDMSYLNIQKSSIDQY